MAKNEQSREANQPVWFDGKSIRKPRASVRKQLSETKQAASPKRAAARSKQHEMEV